MRFRRKKIPPPLDPKIEPEEFQGVYLPYWLADAPRQFIQFLALHSEFTERQRDLLAQWLLGYNAELFAWILMVYGYGGVEWADESSKKTYVQFLDAVSDEYKSHESDLFERLKREMGEGG